MNLVKIGKFLLSVFLGVLGLLATLLFEKNVFQGVTIPLVAKGLGWKARVVSAQLTPFGKLEIQGLEAVNQEKSRIELDSALLVVRPESLFSGLPEIVTMDLKFGLIDLEMGDEAGEGSSVPMTVPLILREASVLLTEGRIRLSTGAWILGGLEAHAQGWDGRTPREIRAKVQKLDWNGPGKQEVAGAAVLKASKSKGSTGDQWEANLTIDVATVVDFSPAELVVPCRLALDGQATIQGGGGVTVDRLQGSWEGVGGVKLASSAKGQWTAVGDWAADLKLEPIDLGIAGILLQSRGVKSVAGKLGGTLGFQGGKKKPITAQLNLVGQEVQILPLAGPAWPPQPDAFSAAAVGAWSSEEKRLQVQSLQVGLTQKGQPQDLQVSLDRAATFDFKGGVPASSEAAVLQWSLRGMELSAVTPLVVAPSQLKVQGGQLSASGRADIQGSTIRLSGRMESRAMKASGSLVQGNLVVDSAAIDFRGNLQGSQKMNLEEAVLSASWEGGAATDLKAKVQAEWEWEKKEGWVLGDGEVGLGGLGRAWTGAKMWPESGQAKVHAEFSGNATAQGSGLISILLSTMHWLGETATPWQAKITSEVKSVAGVWSLPEVTVQADRGGQSLLEGKGTLSWDAKKGEGAAKVDVRKADSSLLVPLLSILTPAWQWKEATGHGMFQYERKGQQDRVEANLQGAITVETGIASQARPVDFSSVEGSVRASWPSTSSGYFSVDALTLIAKHRDGADAIRATLDKPLLLEKIAQGDWKPGGKELATGTIQYSGWPIGIFGPLIFPAAKESSLLGTMTGSIKIQSDPVRGVLRGDVDLKMPDLTITLPHLQLPENQVSLQASGSLDANRQIQLERVQLTSRQGTQGWLEFSAEQDAHDAVAVVGKADLAIAAQNIPDLAKWVSAGSLTLKAEVGSAKEGTRKVGYSTEITSLTAQVPSVGDLTHLGLKSQGIVDWKNGFSSISEVHLEAVGAMGNISIGKLSWSKEGPLSWEEGRIADGWLRILLASALRPGQWIDGDVVLGAGFWQPGNHGGSGEFDVTLLEARLMEDTKLSPASVRLAGDFEYDRRADSFSLKDATLLFPEYRNNPVQIPSLLWRPGSISAQILGGVLDLRGVLAQSKDLLRAPADTKKAGAKDEDIRIDLSVDLQKIVVAEASVGPIKVPRFRWGPEGILLEPSSVRVEGGSMGASIVSSGTGQPVQARMTMSKFPLGAILGSMIADAQGPIGGWIDLSLSGQASGPTIAELRRSLKGQGSFRLYQAHLERLPSMAKALQSTGTLLGSTFIAASQINDIGADFTLEGENINLPSLQVTGTALSANLNGWLNWFAQTLDFKLRFALTKEAMQSSGQLQGSMTQLIGKSNDYYTKVPGEARISGTISDPKVEMDIAKMLMESGINLLLNSPNGILQGANGATGGATAPVTAPIQSALKIFGF